MPSPLAWAARLLDRLTRPPDRSSERREYLRAALASNLEQVARDEGLTREQRIAWLVHHLDLYVSRFFAFAALPDVQPESLVGGDVFAMVELALEAIRAEATVAERASCFETALVEAITAVREARAARTKAGFESLRSIPARLKDA